MSLISNSLLCLLVIKLDASVSQHEDEFKGCYFGIRNKFRYGPGLEDIPDVDNIYSIADCRTYCINWHDDTYYDDIHSCWQMNGWLSEEPYEIYYGLQTDYKTFGSGYCFCEYDEDLTIGINSWQRTGPCSLQLDEEEHDWINPVYQVNQQTIHNGDESICTNNKVSAAAMCYQGIDYIKSVETGETGNHALAIDHYYGSADIDSEYLENTQLNQWITNNNIQLSMSNIYNTPNDGKWGLCDSSFDTICIDAKYINTRFGCWMADCWHVTYTFIKSDNGMYYETDSHIHNFTSFRFYGRDLNTNEYIWEIHDKPPSYKTTWDYKYCRTNLNSPTECNTFIKGTDENEIYDTVITAGACQQEFYEKIES